MLRKQLYKIFITILLIPALLIGVNLLIYNYKLIYDHHRDMLKSDNLRVRSIVYDVTTSLTNICEIISGDSNLHGVFSKDYGSYRQAQSTLSDFTFLKDIYSRYAEVSSLVVYTDNKTMSSYSHVAVIDETLEEWFYGALKYPGYKWETKTYQDRYNNVYKELQVTHPIYIPSSEYNAILVVSISGNYLKNRIDNNNLHVDIAVNNEPIFFSTMNNQDKEMVFETFKPGGFYDFSGRSMYLGEKVLIEASALKPIKAGDFLYIFSVDRQAVGRLRRLVNTEVMIIALSILVPSIIIALYTRQLTWRITTLRTEMHRVTAGDYDIIENFKGNDELADLFNDLKIMIQSIKQRDQRIYEISLEEQRLLTHQRAMEYQLLSSKINPHFLYNTLETIRMKAFNSGNKEVATAVKLLGKHMRYNLEFSGDMKLLSEELDYIRIYLEIQKLRFGHRIHYSIEVDETLPYDKLYIQSLLIQPLVENALIHGHDETLENGQLWIRCMRKEDQLRIEIEDNGRGITEEELTRVMDKIQASHTEEKSSYGLRNIHQRLVLLYGNGCGLTFESEMNVRTCIGFSIPLSLMERKLEC
jgi:two-component system sensor histidine kinase YesM